MHWPAVKMTDMVIGVDFHTITIPPAPPIPMFPHPYFGVIFVIVPFPEYQDLAYQSMKARAFASIARRADIASVPTASTANHLFGNCPRRPYVPWQLAHDASNTCSPRADRAKESRDEPPDESHG